MKSAVIKISRFSSRKGPVTALTTRIRDIARIVDEEYNGNIREFIRVAKAKKEKAAELVNQGQD